MWNFVMILWCWGPTVLLNREPYLLSREIEFFNRIGVKEGRREASEEDYAQKRWGPNGEKAC